MSQLSLYLQKTSDNFKLPQTIKDFNISQAVKDFKLPESAVGFMNRAKPHALPYAVKVAGGSLLTLSHPTDLAVAFLVQQTFSTFGEKALAEAVKKYSIEPIQALAAFTATAGLSVIAGLYVSPLMGYNPSMLSMSVGIAAKLGVDFYSVLQELKKDPFNNGKVIAITQNNFKEEVEQSTIPVIIDAYATWCPPCKTMAPIFEAMAKAHEGKVKFVKLNVTENPELTTKLDIKSMPTFISFNKGQEIGRTSGSQDQTWFNQQINAMIPQEVKDSDKNNAN